MAKAKDKPTPRRPMPSGGGTSTRDKVTGELTLNPTNETTANAVEEGK